MSRELKGCLGDHRYVYAVKSMGILGPQAPNGGQSNIIWTDCKGSDVNYSSKKNRGHWQCSHRIMVYTYWILKRVHNGVRGMDWGGKGG